MQQRHLELNAPGNIEQMEALLDRAPNSVNFTVLWDQSSTATIRGERNTVRYPTPGEAAWGDVGQATLRAGKQDVKFYARSKNNPETNDPRIVSSFTRLGEQDTGQAQILTDFVNYSVTNAPAQSYALVMWNHGGGINGLNLDFQDNPRGSNFTTSRLVSSLTTLKNTNNINLSVLAFDECHMASTEVAYELRTFAPVIVASEDEIAGRGYDYNQAFQALTTNPSGVTNEQLAQSIVDGFQNVYKTNPKQHTLSAISTNQLAGLITAIKAFTTATDTATANDWKLIADASNGARKFQDFERDLGFFMKKIQDETAVSAAIRTAAGQVVTQLQQTVFTQTDASKPTTAGLTIFLPDTQATYEARKQIYTDNHGGFISDAGWITFLDKFFENNPNGIPTGNAATTGGRSVSANSVASADRLIAPQNPLDPSAPSFYNLQAGGLSVLAADAFFDAIAFEETDEPDLYPFAIGATGTASDAITLYSSNPDATFDIALRDASNNLLRQVSGKGNLVLSLQGIAAGRYTLELLADADVLSYSLYAQTPGFDPNRKTFVGNDQYQFNGSLKKAAIVNEGVLYTGNQLLSPTDTWYAAEDWYTFTLPRTPGTDDDPEGTLTVYLAENNRTLKLDLYDEKGALLASNQGSGKISVTYANTSDTTYYFKVSRLAGDTARLGYSFGFVPSETIFPSLSINNATKDGKNTGLLAFGGDASFAGLAVTLTNKSIQQFNVDELGVVVVDDAEGTINGLKPGQTGYVQAALQRGRTIFSVLPDSFVQSPTRVIDGFASTDRFLAFYLINNGTRDGVLNNPALQSQVLFGTAANGGDTGVVSSNALIGDRISVSFRDGSSNSASAVISVSLSDSLRPIGADLQDQPQREIIDLRSFTGNTVQLAFPTVASEAAFNNTVGFYRLESEAGAVRDPLSGAIVNPGDASYTTAAIRSSQQFGITFGRSDSGISRNITGGFLYAPYIISNGSTANVLSGGTSAPSVYFAYLGANPDRADHVRLLGDNTWGFEDLPNLGDADYNDIVIRANLTVV